MTRAIQALTDAEEAAAQRLIARGRNAVWSRQYICEDRFRSRSRNRSPEAATPGASEGLNSEFLNALHGSNHPMEQEACLVNERARK